MKKAIILLFLLLITTMGFSQRWQGFFKPVDKDLFNKSFMRGWLYESAGTFSSVWLFRPTISITAMQFIPDKESGFIVKAFNSMGTGVSYNHYIEQDGLPYSNYGFNLLMLFSYDPGGESAANLQIAGTVTAFQLVNLGIGYSPQLKKPFILTGVTFTFNK